MTGRGVVNVPSSAAAVGVPRSAEHDVDVAAVRGRAAPALADPAVELRRAHAPPPRRAASSMTTTERSPSPRRSRSKRRLDVVEADQVETTSARSSRPSTTSWTSRPSAAWSRRAVVAADDRLLGQELDRRQRHLDARRGQADTIAVPPGRSASQACADRRGAPDDLERVVDAAAGARAAPRDDVGDRSRRPRACAPRRRASSSFAGPRSTATIVAAPASRAAAITCSPTPPQPITHTRSPIRAGGARLTAPNPVTTPQPSSAACHSGISGGIGIAAPARGRPRSRRSRRRSGRAGARSRPRRAAARCRPSACRRRRCARPSRTASGARRHARQPPHDGTKQNTTWSPAATGRRPRRPPSTTPAPSWPSTIGQRPAPSSPSARCRSEWHTPGGRDPHQHLAAPRRRRAGPSRSPPAGPARAGPQARISIASGPRRPALGERRVRRGA